MTKTLTPEQSRLLKALYAAPLAHRFFSVDVVHLVKGLGVRNYPELYGALVACIGKAISKLKLGRYLALMVDIKDGNLMLEREFKKGRNKHFYTVTNLTEVPSIADIIAPTQSDIEEARALEKALTLPPSKAARILDPMLRKKARAERQRARDDARDEELKINAANRAHDREQAKERKEAERGCPQVWGRKTYMNSDDATRTLERIGFGGEVIEGKDSPTIYMLRWLLPVGIGEAHRDLLILKRLSAENFVELSLDVVPVEVLLGKRLGATASRDPRDYEDYSTRLATRMLMSGDTTTPLDFQRRARRGWSPFDT